MKQLISILSILFLCHEVVCQDTKTYEYVGTIQLSDKSIITYKINFRNIGGGKIEGTSVTDIFGENRTKSVIKGNIDEKGKRISFYETENIGTKSTAAAQDFCYINVEKARMRSVGGKTIIQGVFQGKFPNGKMCEGGSVYLLGADFLEELNQKLFTPENLKDNDSLKQIKNRIEELKRKSERTELKNKEVLALKWKSEEVIIEVFDGRTEDSDQINLFIDGKKVLDKFDIKQQKKTIIVPFSGKKSVITVIAVSEGSSGLCTANITMVDGNNTTSLVTILKKGEAASIVLDKPQTAEK